MNTIIISRILKNHSLSNNFRSTTHAFTYYTNNSVTHHSTSTIDKNQRFKPINIFNDWLHYKNLWLSKHNFLMHQTPSDIKTNPTTHRKPKPYLHPTTSHPNSHNTIRHESIDRSINTERFATLAAAIQNAFSFIVTVPRCYYRMVGANATQSRVKSMNNGSPFL